jgi:hypothetical protein
MPVKVDAVISKLKRDDSDRNRVHKTHDELRSRGPVHNPALAALLAHCNEFWSSRLEEKLIGH